MKEGHKVTALDNDRKKINEYGELFNYSIVCDAINLRELQTIGLEVFDYVIVGITDIGTSIAIVANLKELQIRNILCKAKNESHKRILKFLGIDATYIPEEEIAIKVSYKLIHDLQVDTFAVGDNRDTLFVKIPLTNSQLWGKKIQDVEFLRQMSAIIISIKKRNGGLISPARGMDTLDEGDVVYLICHTDKAATLKDYLSPP